MGNKLWFKDWFNSPYYHVLYKNRDNKEAGLFIDNLIRQLHIQPDSKIWDLACGKGRHSVYLNSKGFEVTGTDLSVNSINEAAKSSNAKLDFYIHDMREPFRINYFDCVFNLFTSIGYFENINDNRKVFTNVFSALKNNGLFIIDFFNSNKVIKNLIPEETKEIEGIKFKILKKIENDKVIKRIEFSDNENACFFEEKVSVLTQSDFREFAQKAGFKFVDCYGDYQLNPFNEESSDRLILIFKK